MSKTLAYFTFGFNSSYIDILKLAIKSLKYFHPEIDILIICDEKFIPLCSSTFPGIRIEKCTNSTSPEMASTHKLNIFDYDLSGYDKIMYIDSDMLLHGKIDSILDNITNPDLLYVYAESDDFNNHKTLWWSLNNYTPEQLEFFKTNNILVFNAGLFIFLNSDFMKTHFSNIRLFINSYRGPFFYEQSFMNVYFNLKNKTNTSVINTTNYAMMPKDNINYSNKIIHFAGSPGISGPKIARMTKYITRFMPFLLS
jgi:hypothetical protein